MLLTGSIPRALILPFCWHGPSYCTSITCPGLIVIREALCCEAAVSPVTPWYPWAFFFLCPNNEGWLILIFSVFVWLTLWNLQPLETRMTLFSIMTVVQVQRELLCQCLHNQIMSLHFCVLPKCDIVGWWHHRPHGGPPRHCALMPLWGHPPTCHVTKYPFMHSLAFWLN